MWDQATAADMVYRGVGMWEGRAAHLCAWGVVDVLFCKGTIPRSYTTMTVPGLRSLEKMKEVLQLPATAHVGFDTTVFSCDHGSMG